MLVWDIKDCADVEALTGDDVQRAITEALVYLSVPYEVGRITEANAVAFAAALALHQAMVGPFVRDADGAPVTITAADVRRRVGLRTNAGTASAATIRKHARRMFALRLAEAETAASR